MLIAADIAPECADDASPSLRSRHRELDQFYTRPDVAAACMVEVMGATGGKAALWLEPSAGTGAFLDLLPRPRLGLDLEHLVDHPEIAGGQDFLAWHEWRSLPKPIVTVGNPPFGRNASLALRFLNHAMKFSDHVCMILPRTFEKEAMQAKVNERFHLESSTPLAPFSFIHDGKPYDVPCCFQIWKRIPDHGTRASPDRNLRHSHFRFVELPEDADFAFQRVGARAGLVSEEGLSKSWKSHYFIKAEDDPGADAVKTMLGLIDWEPVRERTAGNPSIGKGELIAAYTLVAGKSRPDPVDDGQALLPF